MFPEIKHISDIMPYLNDEIRLVKKDHYQIVNYMVAREDTFVTGCKKTDSYRRECRGLIFDLEGNLISRPYHKFFNVGELDETSAHNVDLSSPHVVLDKLDGSMIRPIKITKEMGGYKDHIRLATKMGITDVAMNAEVFIADKPNYYELMELLIEDGFTPIFEWISRKNRIVLDYAEDNLVLTAVRHNSIGFYLGTREMQALSDIFNLPVVSSISMDNKSIDEVISIAKGLDREGFVVRFNTGHMVKLKADDYVLKHKSKDLISNQAHVIQLILNNKLDDIKPLLSPSDLKRVNTFESSFLDAITSLANSLVNSYFSIANDYVDSETGTFDKKRYANEFVKSQDSLLQPIYYKIPSAPELTDGFIIDLIKKKVHKKSDIEVYNPLWGCITLDHEVQNG